MRNQKFSVGKGPVFWGLGAPAEAIEGLGVGPPALEKFYFFAKLT